MPKLSDIILDNIKNIYPAIYVQHGDEKTPISLQWYEENKGHVQFVSFALIILYQNGEKKEYYFENYDEMIHTLQKVITHLKK